MQNSIPDITNHSHKMEKHTDKDSGRDATPEHVTQAMTIHHAEWAAPSCFHVNIYLKLGCCFRYW